MMKYQKEFLFVYLKLKKKKINYIYAVRSVIIVS